MKKESVVRIRRVSRIKQLKTENKMLKEFQKQLLELLSTRKVGTTAQISPTVTGKIGGFIPSFLPITEAKVVSPQTIRFPKGE